MKIKKILGCAVLAACVTVPSYSQSNFVEDFLRRYQPPTEPAPATALASSTIAGQVFQTGSLSITLQDVINMMLDHNLDIQTNRYGPHSSYLQSLVFYRALQPSIRFAGTVTRDSSASTSQLNGATALRSLRHNFAINFSQMLPTGTSLAVDATMNRLSNNSSFNTYNPSYTGNIRYTIGQPLLRDRGVLINTRQIRVAQNNQKISETQFEIQVTNLVVQAQKAYWDLVFTGEDLKVKQRSLELAERTLVENQMKVEIGTMAPIDVVQTRSEVAARREQLVLSAYGLTQTEDQIKKLISDEKDPKMFLLRLSAQESPRRSTAAGIPALEDAVRTALENRPEMRQAALELENREIDVRYTANQKLPSLNITGGYTQNGTGGTQTVRGNVLGVNQVLDVIPGGVNNALRQLFSYDYTGYSVGFSLTIPLNNRAAEADYSRAVNERRLSESRQGATAQQIALEVRNALTQVEMNRARIETAQATLDLAQQQLEAEQTKFNLGTSTLRFVLEEQRNVAQAETNELQAFVNLAKALVDLDRAMGMSLSRNNVHIENELPASIVQKRPPAADTLVVGN